MILAWHTRCWTSKERVKAFSGILFLVSRKITNQCSHFVLDLFLRTTIIQAVPYRYGARRGGPAAWNGARRSASFAGLGCLSKDLTVQRGRTGRTTAKGADGTSACPGGSPHERGTSAEVTIPGHPAGRQIHPRAERRRKAASEAPVQLRRSSLASAEPLPVYRCPFPTACGMPAWLAGGRGSGLLPSVPHALAEQEEQN
jgi:hypothetical protein